jgi:HemY protein
LIRTVLILLGITALVALALAGISDAGQASLVWLGYRVDTSAAAAVIIIGIMAFCAVTFWNIALWLSRSPQRAERARASARRKQGDETLTKGFLAVASGDGADARRLAAKALDVCDNIALVRILTAMAAEQSGDDVATKTAYSAMLNVPELKLAGLKGLMQLAKSQGEKAEAVKLAGEAYNQPKPAMWAFETLFEARLEAGEWAEALDLIDGALNRKLISPLFSERAKASLMAASAARLETSDDAQMRDQALDYAQRAAKLQPAFTPAAIIAARLLGKAGKMGRAEDVLEAAWGAQPHPAIWLTYRDIVSNETPKERARRLQGLIDRNKTHRESRMLQLERALLSGAKPDITAAMTALADDATEDKLTKRVSGLMSRGAQALGDLDTARTWVAQAALAKGEPEWSDIDAEAKAFAYSASDWSDLILTFARNATLAHPRYERGEKGLPEVPELSSRYVPSMPFIKATRKSATGRTNPIPQPDDPGDYDTAISGQDLDVIEAAPVKPSRARRAAPRAKK